MVQQHGDRWSRDLTLHETIYKTKLRLDDLTSNSNLLQKGYMQVAFMGLSLDAHENVVQNDKYNLQFVTSLFGECFAFCWDEVLISPHFWQFCTPGIYIKVSGSPKEAHDWLQPTQRGDPTSSSSTSVCAPSI